MPDRTVRTSANASRRTTGLLVAAAVSLILAGVVLFVAINHRPTGQAAPLPGNVVDIGKPPPAGPSADPTQIQDSGAARLQFVDKNDPARLGSELAYEKLDPIGPGYYALTQPRAWLYLRDGRTLHIRADSGKVKMPSRTQQPESGEFRGGVVVKVFPPAGTGAKPIEPETDTPVIIGASESVSFDSVLLELTTQDPVTISTKAVLFEGEGLRVRGNQVKERIEKLQTRGKSVRLNPRIKDDHPSEPSPPKPQPSLAGSGSPRTPSDEPAAVASPAAAANSAHKEQLYKAMFSDDVALTQTTRKLTSDTLEIFARLIDNKLPENALGEWARAPGEASSPAQHAPTAPRRAAKPAGDPTDAAVAAAMKIEHPPVPSLFVSAGDDDIVLNWSGSLVMVPIAGDAVPRELSDGNHFAARFSADKPGGQKVVGLSDSQTHSTGECARIEYAATTRILDLASGPDAPNVRFESPDSGRIIVPSARVDLGTGAAHVPGGGLLATVRGDKPSLAANTPAEVTDGLAPDHSAPLSPDLGRQITWTEQADFQFRTANGRIQEALDSAKLTGSVLARDRSSSISGDTLAAAFAPVGKQQSAIKHLTVIGHALGVAGPRTVDPERALPAPDPFVACDRLDVDFAPSRINPDDVDPTLAVAVGSAHAADKDASLHTQRLEATMSRDDKGELAVTDVVGKGDVLFERTDGVTARGDDLLAHPVKRTATLTGQVVDVTRGESKITGTQADFNDAAGTVFFFGAGALDHLQVDASRPGDPTHITATWTKSMLFNNTLGTVECDGQTVATAESALESETLLSNRLRLWLTPASQADKGSTTPPAQGATTGQMAITDGRKLLRAEAIGESQDREGAPHASIQIRRYAPPLREGEERTLEQVFYMAGPRILADDVKGTVNVPAAGLAVVRDQRLSPKDATPKSAATAASGLPLTPLTSGGAKGTSRFTWGESMLFTRATGVLSMKKDVELIHVPLGSDQVTRLVGMRLDATFSPTSPGPGAAASRSTDLIHAEARGAVYAESGQQRLLCDEFDYDAKAGTAEASATQGNRVTAYDDRKGTQLVARRLFWDLIKDRIEIKEPDPTTAPH